MMTVSFGTAAQATGDVLQEQERDLFARAQLDEVRALERTFGEQHPVVGENADRITTEVRKAAEQRRAVELLELLELRVIYQACDHLARVVGLAQAHGHYAIELLGIVTRRPRRLRRCARTRWAQARHDAPRDAQRVGVILGVVIAHARLAAVHIGPAE